MSKADTENTDTEKAESTERLAIMPPKTFALDPEVRWILGRPNFWCKSIADALREAGVAVDEKAEDEQAVAIYWMLQLYLEYGEDWREEGSKLLSKAQDDSQEHESEEAEL